MIDFQISFQANALLYGDYNQRFDRADSWIHLQWCQEITVHECAKLLSTEAD